MSTPLIRTFVFPPPMGCRVDWMAVTDNYEPGDPIGNGATEEEAREDLLAQLEEARERAAFKERCTGSGHKPRGNGA